MKGSKISKISCMLLAGDTHVQGILTMPYFTNKDSLVSLYTIRIFLHMKWRYQGSTAIRRNVVLIFSSLFLILQCIWLFLYVNSAGYMQKAALYNLTTLCLNGTLSCAGADLGGGGEGPPPSSGNHSEKGKMLLFANCKIKHFAFSECRKCHFRGSICSKFPRISWMLSWEIYRIYDIAVMYIAPKLLDYFCSGHRLARNPSSMEWARRG